MRFLHIADVHLGCTRYNLPESPRDFFDAWIDVLKKYAIEEKVDFVIMCGDFFHKRQVPPETMNYAVEGLSIMRDAEIPVVTIEGNHDQKFNDIEFSWLRSLGTWGLVKLLEPVMKDDVLTYEPWDEDQKKGGYIDIGRARIFGSNWYGASGNWAIPMLTRAIRENRREGAFHILMLHTDIEGHQVHPIPALSVDALSQLKTAVEYVGLGHTHKHYEIDNWAFNPGSIEVTNISEFREQRGAFIVDVAEDNSITVRHVDEYVHRPFQQLSIDVTNYSEPRQLTDAVIEKTEREARRAEEGKPQPIIEIGFRGRLGFPNSQIETTKIRNSVYEITGALHVRVKNHTVPNEILEPAADLPDEDREHLERRVVSAIVAADSRFNARADAVAQAVIGAKRMALVDEPAEMIADFISEAIVKK